MDIEKRIVEVAEAIGCTAELCQFRGFDALTGQVSEHSVPREPVRALVQILLAEAAQEAKAPKKKSEELMRIKEAMDVARNATHLLMDLLRDAGRNEDLAAMQTAMSQGFWAISGGIGLDWTHAKAEEASAQCQAQKRAT